MAGKERAGKPGYGTYLLVWAALVVFTIAAATSGRFITEGRLDSLPLVIAFVKTCLVAAIFMNLKYERGIVRASALFALGIILVLGLLTFSDYGYR